jgi:hypothetical protein
VRIVGCIFVLGVASLCCGQALNDPINSHLSNLVANVLNYGAVLGRTTVDGAMTATSSTFGATGSSTSPATTSGTTSFNSEVVISAYAFSAAGGSFTAPGTPTQRATLAASSGNYPGFWFGDQTIATAGSYSANTGTLTSSVWDAFAIPLIPTSGNTISFVNAASAHADAASLTVSKPASTATGNTMILCVQSFGSNNTWGIGGWNQLTNLLSGTLFMACYARVASASEPSSYTIAYPAGNSIQTSAVIATYTNVAAVDTTLTSATAAFTTADVGKYLCVWQITPNLSALNSASCGPIGIVANSTTVYALTANLNSSALSSSLIAIAADSSAAFSSAVSALASGGTVYVPAGVFLLRAGTIAIPVATNVNFVGAGSSTPLFVAGASGTGTRYIPTNPTGSSLIVVGDANNDPAIQYNFSVVGGQSPNGSVTRVSDISLLGTGQGGDGIDYYQTHGVFERLNIQGFLGNGILLEGGPTGSGFVGYVTVRDNLIQGNGLTDVYVAGGGDSPCCITIGPSNELNRAGTYPLEIGNSSSAIEVMGNDIQWSGNCSIYITVAALGINIHNNWLETGGICDVATAGLQAPVVVANYFNSNVTIESNGNSGWVIQGNRAADPIPQSGTLSLSTIDATNIGAGFSTSFTGTSGTASCTFGDLSGNVTVSCYLNGYANTSTAQTWTFPLPLITTPSVGGTSCGTYSPSASSTVLTLPANAAMTAETCQVIVNGQTS